jgi:hypothetical protein
MFGYGVIISDVCVSWEKPDGTYFTQDCLQKVYPVGSSIIAGFSGSVQIGFALLQSLRDFLILPEDAKNNGWKPDWVADNWKVNAKRIFVSFPKDRQKDGAAILFVGAHPVEDIGIPDFAKIFVVVMKAPEFEPVVISKPSPVLSVGSGSYVEEYRKVIEDITKDGMWHPLMQMETGFPGGWGTAILTLISETVEKNPKIGISQHLHIGIVRRYSYTIQPNDSIKYPASGEKVEFKMPEVAKSYKEFQEISRKVNLKADTAVC